YLGQFDIHLAKWLFRRQHIMLDYMVSGSDTAKDRGISSGPKDVLLRWIDHAALRIADTVIVDTEEHLQALPEKYRHKGLVVSVGAPASWFAVAQPLPSQHELSQRPLKVVF